MAMGAGKTTAIDHQAFVAELTRLFPDALADIDPDIDGGLLHLEMGAFCRFTEEAIKREDRAILVRCFQFVERLLLNGDASVKNAVHVSYLEHLDLESAEGRKARAHMPSAVIAAWNDITAYNAQIARSSSQRKPTQERPKR
jgi:hypothetical protein